MQALRDANKRRSVAARKGRFFPSNARWLSPGRLSSRKDNCILQIHRINAVATLAVAIMTMWYKRELNWIDTLSCHRVRPKANTKNPKTNKPTKTPKSKQHEPEQKQKPAPSVVSWSVSSWTIGKQEEMITLYHLRDWYGNVKQKAKQQTTKCHTTICEPESNRCTMRNKAPQPGAHRVQAARATFSVSWIRSKASKTLSCRIFFFRPTPMAFARSFTTLYDIAWAVMQIVFQAICCWGRKRELGKDLYTLSCRIW